MASASPVALRLRSKLFDVDMEDMWINFWVYGIIVLIIITSPGSGMGSNSERCLVTCDDHFSSTVGFLKVWDILLSNTSPSHHPEF